MLSCVGKGSTEPACFDGWSFNRVAPKYFAKSPTDAGSQRVSHTLYVYVRRRGESANQLIWAMSGGFLSEDEQRT